MDCNRLEDLFSLKFFSSTFLSLCLMSLIISFMLVLSSTEIAIAAIFADVYLKSVQEPNTFLHARYQFILFSYRRNRCSHLKMQMLIALKILVLCQIKRVGKDSERFGKDLTGCSTQRCAAYKNISQSFCL